MKDVEDWAEIRRLRRAEAMPIKAVARVVGCPKNTVKAALASRPNVALGHLASKLITVLFTCMTRNQPYDQERLAHDMGLEIPAAAKA